MLIDKKNLSRLPGDDMVDMLIGLKQGFQVITFAPGDGGNESCVCHSHHYPFT